MKKKGNVTFVDFRKTPPPKPHPEDPVTEYHPVMDLGDLPSARWVFGVIILFLTGLSLTIYGIILYVFQL